MGVTISPFLDGDIPQPQLPMGMGKGTGEIFVLDAAIVKSFKCFSWNGGFLNNFMLHKRRAKQINYCGVM